MCLSRFSKLLMPVLFALKKPRHQSLFPDMKKPGILPGSLLLPAVRLSRFILSSLAFLQFLTSLLYWYPLIPSQHYFSAFPSAEDTLLLLWR